MFFYKENWIKRKKYDKYYYVAKIYNKYKHDDIKIKLNGLLDKLLMSYKKMYEIVIHLIEDINKNLTDMYKKYNRFDPTDSVIDIEKFSDKDYEKIIKQPKKQIFDFLNLWMGCDVKFMDIYVMRRILDKDYITNSIVYVGAQHASSYIHDLVKYFDFNITHISKLYVPSKVEKDKKLGYLKKIIMKYNDDDNFKYTNIINKFLKKYDEDTVEEQQCSDYSNFPENFE